MHSLRTTHTSLHLLELPQRLAFHRLPVSELGAGSRAERATRIEVPTVIVLETTLRTPKHFIRLGDALEHSLRVLALASVGESIRMPLAHE
eukprot:EC684327.1.p1 GENE.EC684327.1~~EC684327.1.p1  ORF type:complete len:91 (-),score=28.25 EC684327.1:192-464(-)